MECKLRPPKLEAISGTKLHGNKRLTTGSILAAFVSHHHDQLSRNDSEEPDDDDGDSSVEENNGGSNDAGTTEQQEQQRQNDPPMERCISLLEPHLAAFRMSCDNNSNNVNDSPKDEVPPQLLRVARFFRWRWEPMRRALLRPYAMDDESSVEVGSVYRLRLVRALHLRGLLGTAELDGLEASFASPEMSDNESTGEVSDSSQLRHVDGPRKRKRKEEDLYNRVKLALTRLPLDAATPVSARRAIKHARAVLVEYNQWWEELSVNNGSREAGDELLPEQVADWALTAFTGIVVANGMDHACEKARINEHSMEATMVSSLLWDGDGAVCRAVKLRILSILSPEAIDTLTSLHILSLSRLFSHISVKEVERYISGSVFALCSTKHDATSIGLMPLAKVTACHLSLSGIHAEDNSTAPFETSIRRLVETELQTLEKNISITNARMQKFLPIFFSVVSYLLTTS